MKSYYTVESRKGLRLPPSGVVIGIIADALRLKGVLRDLNDGKNYKTAQRYFAGERVEPEAAAAVREALVDALIPGATTFPLWADRTVTLADRIFD